MVAIVQIYPEGSPEPFELRPYQQRVINELYALMRNKVQRILVYAPTGSGKTAIASRVILHAVDRRRRVLFIVHRDPLVEQTRSALVRDGVATGLIGILKPGYKEDRSRPIQIASIQTLARRELPVGIELVICDECHTTAWFQTYEVVKVTYPTAWQVGLTATPWRLKSKTEFFGQHFDAIVLGPSPKELISQGHLVPPRYFGFGGIEDFTKLKIDKMGDFDERQMQSLFMQPENLEKVLEEIKKHCDGRTGVIFCSGVEHSRTLTNLLNSNSIITEHLEADTPHDVRREMYVRLETGETRFLSSVGTLTEGFDVPSISAVVLARATQSLSLYLQMVGRGLRLSPSTGKQDCLLLDFGANVGRHGFLAKDRKITLEVTTGEEGNAPIRNCPECHAEIYAFLKVCPECGYEFPSTEKSEGDEEEFELTFGEMFDEATWEMVKYLRQQRKYRFTKKLSPEALWDTFSRRFPGQILVNDWLLGAIFNEGIKWESNRQIFRDYLHEVSPTQPPNPKWVKFQVDIEFGVEGRQYRTGKTQSYTARCDNWWDVLECRREADWNEIKQAYREMAKVYHPDTSSLSIEEATEMMQRLNAAFELAKLERKTAKPSKPTKAESQSEPQAQESTPTESDSFPADSWVVIISSTDESLIGRKGEVIKRYKGGEPGVPDHFAGWYLVRVDGCGRNFPPDAIGPYETL